MRQVDRTDRRQAVRAAGVRPPWARSDEAKHHDKRKRDHKCDQRRSTSVFHVPQHQTRLYND